MDQLQTLLQAKFNLAQANYRYIKSPLRICPLGAHVDHQHGMVTGMTINVSIDMVYIPNADGLVRVQSLDFPDEEYFSVDNVPVMVPGYWGNYLRGSVLALKQDHVLKQGFSGVIRGKFPIGGLSSSAAVTTAYLMALCDVNNISFTKEDLIRYSHWVENNYIGLNNGILDQAANILSRKGYLMFLDTRTSEHKLIERAPDAPDFEVVVVYSGLSKALIGTDYNKRVDECKVSAWILQDLAQREIASLKETFLRDVDFEEYRRLREELPERFRKRADHFFLENQRVLQGIEYWKAGNLEQFGRLMFESGESSVKNYECGCPELISIFEILQNTPGVYGARFSGAGYRGCCIGLIDPAAKEAIQSQIELEYPARHPQYKDSFKVEFFAVDDGARFVNQG